MFQQIDAPTELPQQGSTADASAHHAPHALEQSVWAHVQHTPLASMWDLQGVPVKEVAKRVWNGIDEDSLFGRASQLAYSFFAAIFPALIAMAALMGIVAKSSGKLYFELLGKIGQLIPPSAFELVTETFQKTTSASTPGKVTFGLLVCAVLGKCGHLRNTGHAELRFTRFEGDAGRSGRPGLQAIALTARGRR